MGSDLKVRINGHRRSGVPGGPGGRSGTVRVASWGRFPRQFGSLFELVQSYMYRVEGPKISIRVTPGSSPAACCHRIPLWARLWTTCDLWRGGFGRWGPFTAVARLFRADGFGWPGGPRQILQNRFVHPRIGPAGPGSVTACSCGLQRPRILIWRGMSQSGIPSYGTRQSGGKGGANQQSGFSPPALPARLRATTCQRGRSCIVLCMRRLPVTAPGAPCIVSVRRNRRGARESGKWLVGVSRWSPHKVASDRHVPHHW